ncbi:MAG: hypothetical protein Q9166_006849 [cf. Caloplaca sp. 2 TL-2023]
MVSESNTSSIMRFLPHLLAGALCSLSALAQTPVGALFQAITEYKEANARLVDGKVATDINQANDQLDIAAQTFVPKVPCATISAVFIYLQGNITDVNSQLRDIACSTAIKTQAAAKLNAEAFRRAISDQVIKVDLLGTLFARNNACNNKQSTEALQKFAAAVQAVDADDKKTAQAFTLIGGTLGCVL